MKEINLFANPTAGNPAIYRTVYFDGFVQNCSNSSALAMELLQFSTKPSISCHDLDVAGALFSLSKLEINDC